MEVSLGMEVLSVRSNSHSLLYLGPPQIIVPHARVARRWGCQGTEIHHPQQEGKEAFSKLAQRSWMFLLTLGAQAPETDLNPTLPHRDC